MTTLEKRLAAGPVIAVPTITLEGRRQRRAASGPGAYATKFSGKYAHRADHRRHRPQPAAGSAAGVRRGGHRRGRLVIRYVGGFDIRPKTTDDTAWNDSSGSASPALPGTGTRYLVVLWAAQRLGSTFPYGTLIVNLAGSFVIAALMHAAFVFAWSPNLRAVLAIGFVGGLTTYSSFNYETMRLFEEGAPAAAVMNLGLTLFGCFLAGWLGLVAARELLGR